MTYASLIMKAEYINRFKNGIERYQKSPTLNKVVNSLASGIEHYELIDQLVKIIDNQNELMLKLALNGHGFEDTEANGVVFCGKCGKPNEL